MNDDFYVGWSSEAPKGYNRKAMLFFAVALLSLVVIAIVYVRSEKGFVDSLYEFGTLQEVSGELVEHPAWGIKTSQFGEEKTVLLVGFGKAGAGETLKSIVNKNNLMFGQQVTLRGQVFHFQDKYGMELTAMEESFVSAENRDVTARNIKDLGRLTLEGEIVDPKCFFGVMDPATKAVHRSCAVRCISGGIPPVLAIRENGVFVDYYILNSKIEDLSKEILPMVGVPVTLSGRVTQYDDWKALEVSPADIQLVAQSNEEPGLTAGIAMCGR